MNFVVCCLVFGACGCCLLFAVCGLRLLAVVCGVRFVVCGVWFAVRCLLCVMLVVVC